MLDENMEGYNPQVETVRELEYPMLKDTIYLDHAGTTVPAKSLIERFAADMVGNLYGNPHSASVASQRTSIRVEDARLRLLRLFNADVDEFDLVFVASATAGMKLVMDAFSAADGGFWYGYHKDSHTSLVGVREAAEEHVCFDSDAAVDAWIQTNSRTAQPSSGKRLALFAYPAQSNMDGRRLPLRWAGEVRRAAAGRVLTLLDAAAFVSTSPLNLNIAEQAPDFTVLSLYKMFGFPDLGALIVRKQSGYVFERRRYFGGGTVDMVLSLREPWHARKTDTLHDQLEDGTLPIHSISAVHAAIDVHCMLFDSFECVSKHCTFLSKNLFDGLSQLRHWNNAPVCKIYTEPDCDFTDSAAQGPIIAFNLMDSRGGWVPNSELEKLAATKGISMRSGGLCNPGGIAAALQLSPWEMKRNFSAGQRCGSDDDIMHGKPTGVARVSLGPMSTLQDVDGFLDFMKEFFVEYVAPVIHSPNASSTRLPSRFYVESLTVYPIKSCGGWKVPVGQPWPVHKEGLGWDREWCLVRRGSGVALSQKRYPRMALIKPVIDIDQGVLRISSADLSTKIQPIEVPLSANPAVFARSTLSTRNTKVCGDTIAAQPYEVEAITEFFTQALGVACQLARFPPTGSAASTRHAKAHLQPYQLASQTNSIPGAFPRAMPWDDWEAPRRPILLSNESPILLISRSSLNRLNEQIKHGGQKAVAAEVFRANIVVAEHHACPPGSEEPYAEDAWRFLKVGHQHFQILGSCRRCQMVCINQETGDRNQEPLATLAKFRRLDGKVFFGQHACHMPLISPRDSPGYQNPTVQVGDPVQPLLADSYELGGEL